MESYDFSRPEGAQLEEDGKMWFTGHYGIQCCVNEARLVITVSSAQMEKEKWLKLWGILFYIAFCQRRLGDVRRKSLAEKWVNNAVLNQEYIFIQSGLVLYKRIYCEIERNFW